MVDFIFIFIFFPRQQRLGNGDEDADHVFGDATLTTSINVSTIYYSLALFNRKIIIESLNFIGTEENSTILRQLMYRRILLLITS